MKSELIIAISAAFAAIFSAIFAFRGNFIANKALQIAREEQNARAPRFDHYLVDSFKSTFDNEYIIGFNVSFINKSNTSDSIVKIDLKIFYSTTGGIINHLLFPIQNEINEKEPFSNFKRMRVPLKINAKSAESGWVLFRVPTQLITGAIEKYQINSITASDKIIEINSYIVKNIYYEKTDAQN